MDNSNIKGLPLEVDVNVDIKVKNKKGKLINNIQLHNKATKNMTEGIVRFLRGEFTNSNLDIEAVGSYQNYAKYYIPAYMSLGDINVDYTKSPPYSIVTGKEYEIVPQYTDEALRREVFVNPYSDNGQYIYHRFKIKRSVLGDSVSTDVYQLVLSSVINFNENQKFYYSTGTPVIGTSNGVYYISEVGLFSADVGDNRGKLLARLLLDVTNPLKIEKNTTVVINWTLGVRSVNDNLGSDRKDYEYKYISQQTNYNDVTWSTYPSPNQSDSST